MIDRIDHLVLTVASAEATCAFYGMALGMVRIDTPGRPVALGFGQQKINLHAPTDTFAPKAAHPVAGSADLCLIAAIPLASVIARLREADVPVEQGPVARNGALGPMMSVYIRDPDGNLIEIGRYDGPQADRSVRHVPKARADRPNGGT